MDNGNKRTLTINIGKENQSVVEDITKEKIDKSFFSEQYREALRVINAYLDHLPKPSTNDCKKKEDRFKEDDANNIIAFVGDRGSGKTSCMESVAKYLASNNKDIDEYNKVKEQKFYALSLVEPAFFDDEHNVVSLVIASLYDEFCKEDKNLDKDHEKKLRVAKCFSKVQEELEWMVSKYADNNSDTFEKLTNLANAVKLKQDIKTLVDEFLDFMGYGKEAILLLCIDDIDLNTKCADRMTESIRKYLIQTNILVLLSAKVEQLEKVKQLAFVNEYKNLLEKEEKTGFTHEDVKEMVDKFITKFLPRVHRIHMPELSSERIAIAGEDTPYEKWYNALPELIYNRTKLRFHNYGDDINPLIPHNLRELCQFVSMFYSMNKSTSNVNAHLFFNYIFSEWAERNVTNEYLIAIKEIRGERGVSKVNKTTLRQIDKLYNQTISTWKDITDIRYKEALRILDSRNRDERISMGDVFGIIHLLHIEHNDINDKNFFFLVNCCYTQLLYKYETLNDTDNLRKLVAGCFINSIIVETMAPEKVILMNITRSRRRINLKALDIKGLCTSLHINLEKLILTEFVVLCSGRNHTSRSDETFRKSDEDCDCNRDLTNISRAYFDVNSFIYNIINIDATYKRFGEDFLQKASEIEGSLYNMIKAKHKSDTISNIADAETVSILTERLSNYRLKTSSSFVAHLGYYFDRLSKDIPLTTENGSSSFCIHAARIVAQILQVSSKSIEKSRNEFFRKLWIDVYDIANTFINTNKVGCLKGKSQSFANTTIIKSIQASHPIYKDKLWKVILQNMFQAQRYSKEEAKKIIDDYNDNLKKQSNSINQYLEYYEEE